MKKIAVGICLIFGLTILQPVSAAVNPSIVIVDTAIDTTANQFIGKTIYEVCVMETNRCPNNTSFMEGKGSASLPVSQAYTGGFEHGTYMASIATQINPNLNIIFIRIVPMASNGSTGVYTDTAVQMASKWIIANKTKFNIVAMSASIGRHNFSSQTNYCPVNANMKNSIIALQNNDIAPLFAAGNGYDYSRIDYPACISEAIAVGSVDKTSRISLYSNGGTDLDFYALGDYTVPAGKAVGTSAATVALASYWAKNYKGSYLDTYKYIKSISQSTENTKIKSTSFVDILK